MKKSAALRGPGMQCHKRFITARNHPPISIFLRSRFNTGIAHKFSNWYYRTVLYLLIIAILPGCKTIDAERSGAVGIEQIIPKALAKDKILAFERSSNTLQQNPNPMQDSLKGRSLLVLGDPLIASNLPAPKIFSLNQTSIRPVGIVGFGKANGSSTIQTVSVSVPPTPNKKYDPEREARIARRCLIWGGVTSIVGFRMMHAVFGSLLATAAPGEQLLLYVLSGLLFWLGIVLLIIGLVHLNRYSRTKRINDALTGSPFHLSNFSLRSSVPRLFSLPNSTAKMQVNPAWWGLGWIVLTGTLIVLLYTEVLPVTTAVAAILIGLLFALVAIVLTNRAKSKSVKQEKDKKPRTHLSQDDETYLAEAYGSLAIILSSVVAFLLFSGQSQNATIIDTAEYFGTIIILSAIAFVLFIVSLIHLDKLIWLKHKGKTKLGQG